MALFYSTPCGLAAKCIHLKAGMSNSVPRGAESSFNLIPNHKIYTFETSLKGVINWIRHVLIRFKAKLCRALALQIQEFDTCALRSSKSNNTIINLVEQFIIRLSKSEC